MRTKGSLFELQRKPRRSYIRKSQAVTGTQLKVLAGALECAEVSYRKVILSEDFDKEKVDLTGCTAEQRQVVMEANQGGLTWAHAGPPKGHNWYSGRRIKRSKPGYKQI